MKGIIILIGILSLILLTGCKLNGAHAFDFNATSYAGCSLNCTDLMKEHTCFSASPSYSSSIVNGHQTKGICSCFIDGCLD